MFALEVNFKDSSDRPVLMFIRRPQALIGATNFANVVLDDMKGLAYQIRLSRSLGRGFKLSLVASDAENSSLADGNWPKWIEGSYVGSKQFDLGRLKLSVVALDSDLILKDGEPLDKAGFRVLRQSLKSSSPLYPAVAFGNPEVVVSFNTDTPILLGRGRDCPLRIESPDVSGRHARIGFDSNTCWIEDLGSTNGTFISGDRVTGRRTINTDDTILIARQIPLRIIISEETQHNQAVMLETKSQQIQGNKLKKQKQYPCLISLSEVVKPGRIVLDIGRTVNLGRDPASDFWVGAPHVSRMHLQIRAASENFVSISDVSTNGTEYDCGRLPRDLALESEMVPHVFDLGHGITIGLVFNEEQERIFVKSGGALAAFGGTFAEAIENDEFQALGQVKLSDVSQLVGRRGRKATAHEMKAIYKSSPKTTKLIILIFSTLFILLIGILLILFGSSMF